MAIIVGIVWICLAAKHEGMSQRALKSAFESFTDAKGGEYKGYTLNEKPNGRGVHTKPDGSKYEGDFVDGKKSGYGTYVFVSGHHKYVGEWKEGHFSGHGVYTWPDGSTYEGDWLDGKRNGRGVMMFASGEVYVGEYADDKNNGRGTTKFANGNEYKGQFKTAWQHGMGCFSTRIGEFVGEWKEGKIFDVILKEAGKNLYFTCEPGKKKDDFRNYNVETTQEEFEKLRAEVFEPPSLKYFTARKIINCNVAVGSRIPVECASVLASA